MCVVYVCKSKRAEAAKKDEWRESIRKTLAESVKRTRNGKGKERHEHGEDHLGRGRAPQASLEDPNSLRSRRTSAAVTRKSSTLATQASPAPGHTSGEKNRPSSEKIIRQWSRFLGAKRKSILPRGGHCTRHAAATSVHKRCTRGLLKLPKPRGWKKTGYAALFAHVSRARSITRLLFCTGSGGRAPLFCFRGIFLAAALAAGVRDD